jgi:LmbE family N-acetylglucosaminyl deacetylase
MDLPGAWRPIMLPHVEVDGGRVRFPDRDTRTATSAPDLPGRCDGSRPLADFTAEERDVLGQWQRAGLVVMAPGHPRALPGSDTPVVVSPHPDDAALALGGTLALRGGRVLDVFSIETWTKEPYYAARPELTSRLLLDEESVACRVLGVEAELLGFVDAADRPRWRDRFFTDDVLSDRSTREEPDLVEELTNRLAKALVGAAEVYVPLGVGGHVDHLACREAVIALVARGELTGSRVVFYEDQPYSLFSRSTLTDEVARGLAPRLAAVGLGEPGPELVPLDATAVLTKREALRAYRIQVRQGVLRRLARRDSVLAADSGHPAAERIWRVGDVDTVSQDGHG